MEFLIPCTKTEEKLTNLNSLPSRANSINATRITKFEPILKILEETEPDILPDFFYRRKCGYIFTMKKDLQRVEKENKLLSPK